MDVEHVDVVIVGASLSGIGAGYHLQTRCPDRSYAILEGRDAIGGTWDLFRYPGIRSDSDMYTLGYSFKPWTGTRAIADGLEILRYVRETAQENGIDRHIRFGHRVRSASWSSADARWTVEARRGDETVRFTCDFLLLCGGYYKYAEGYTPDFAGRGQFKGRIVHPQRWPDDLDHAGKQVVVIGSGATAVTLVPAMATTAAHVVMLQRSPTYIVSQPAEDELANWTRARLPGRLAYALTRWRKVLQGMLFYRLARHKPAAVKAFLLKGVRAGLGPDYDVETHFTPTYKPWDQRVCLVPDADLFEAIKAGRASVVTDRIERFDAAGIVLQSGRRLDADLIVTATGLTLEPMNGLAITVDGRRVEPARTLCYKGMMYSDVPNLASCVGYTNASWTLKCDLTCEYICRLLGHMARTGLRQCTPRNQDPTIAKEPCLDFSSGYVQRSIDELPKQGSRAPWKLYQNYVLDLMNLRYAPVDDGVMEFSIPGGVHDRPPRPA